MKENNFKNGPIQTSGVDDKNSLNNLKIEGMLRNIEGKRFRSLDDPGVVGIKYRLSHLDFINNTDYISCSGHSNHSEYKELQTGYLEFSYKKNNPRAIEFNNNILKIISETQNYKACIKGRITGGDKDRSSNEKIALGIERGEEIIYDVIIEHKKNSNPQLTSWQKSNEIIELLKLIWNKFSEVLNNYEEIPIPEKIEGWYFAFGSLYGKMECKDETYSKYIEEIKKRGGNFDKKWEHDKNWNYISPY